MSNYEKIGLLVITLLLLVMSVFSYHEIKEPPEKESSHDLGPNFNASMGKDLKIGMFTSVVSEESSGGVEDHCNLLGPVIIAALHDVKENLEAKDTTGYFSGGTKVFEVNNETIALLCHKNAKIVLADANKNRLFLEKEPFKRAIPPQGTSDDIGSEVRITATILSPGGVTPVIPSVSGDILIPDRFLDLGTASSS